MSFAATTLDRVMGALALPLTRFYVEAAQDALNHAAEYGGNGAIARIEGYLTQYEAAQTALNQGAESAALVKAAVLEWQPGARNAGYKAEMVRLRSAIASSLNLNSPSNKVRLIR